jgi:uncharacterized protein YegL
MARRTSRSRTLPLAAGAALMMLALAALLPPATAQQDSPIILESVRIDARLQDAVLVTIWELELSNPDANGSREQTLNLPISRQGTVTNITLSTHNDTLYGIVKPKAKAEQQYNATKAQGKTAGLVTNSAPGHLVINVNIQAGTRVLLKATTVEILPVDLGHQKQTLGLAAISRSLGSAGVAIVNLDLASTAGWESAHATLPGLIQTMSETNRVHYRLEAQTHRFTQDLVFDAKPKAPGYRSQVLLSGTGNDAAAIIAVMPPTTGVATFPQDVVLVLDRSGSMSGSKMSQAQEAMSNLIDQLGANDRVGLVSFSSDVTAFSNEMTSLSPQGRQDAKAWIQSLHASGATDILAGLQRALSILGQPRSQAHASIVLITDGQPTSGVTHPQAIIDAFTGNNTHEVRLHTLGIGFDQDNAFLTQLARSHHGHYAPITVDATVAQQLEDFFTRVSGALIRNPVVTTPGLQMSQRNPESVPDLYLGSHLILAGRINGSQLPANITVRVDGQAVGGAQAFTTIISTAGAPRLPEVLQLWARQQALTWERRLALTDDEAERDSLRDALKTHGVRYQIETTQTSWALVPKDLIVAATDLPPDEVRAQPHLADQARFAIGTTTGTFGAGGGSSTPSASDNADGQEPQRTPALSAMVAVLLLAGLAGLWGRRKP